MMLGRYYTPRLTATYGFHVRRRRGYFRQLHRKKVGGWCPGSRETRVRKKAINQFGITNMSKKTLALIVNPKSGKPVQSIEINGYDDIKELFGKSADPEGSTLCHLQGDTYLQVWADCEQYMVAPAWVTAFNRQ